MDKKIFFFEKKKPCAEEVYSEKVVHSSQPTNLAFQL